MSLLRMNKITQKEYDSFVQQRLYSEGFSKDEREVIRSVFTPDLEDAEPGESGGLFSAAVPGISGDEIKRRMEELRDGNSPLSKGLKIPFYRYPDKLNKLEKILGEALKGSKEPWL
jgi:hypothetical protein